MIDGEVMRLVRSKVDPTADGELTRLIIGNRGDDISGALYIRVREGVQLPKSVLIAIPTIVAEEEA